MAKKTLNDFGWGDAFRIGLSLVNPAAGKAAELVVPPPKKSFGEKLGETIAAVPTKKPKKAEPKKRWHGRDDTAERRAEENDYDFGKGFEASIENQGGWGLSKDTRYWLGDTGDGDSVLGKYLEPITDAPANLADLGFRALQGVGAAADSALMGVDEAVAETGVADALRSGGQAFAPGKAVRSLAEAFPSGFDDLILNPAARVKRPKTSKRGATLADTVAEYDDIAADIENPRGYVYSDEITDPLFAKPAPATPIKKTTKAAAPNRTAAEIVADEIAANTPQPGVNPSTVATPSATPAAASNISTPTVPAFDDLVGRMTTALKSAGKASDEQLELTANFRKEQAARLREAQAKGVGKDGLNIELAALKGRAEKADFEAVENQFTQDEIVSLFENVKNSPAFQQSPFESMNARQGLRKLLEGEVPTQSEMMLLRRVFPGDFIKAAMSKRTAGDKMASFFGNAINLPRAVMATGDFSAPLRQGIFTIGRKEFYKALPSMFKEFAHVYRKNDEMKDQMGSNWQSSGSLVLDEIRQRPTYDLMDRAKLAITDKDSVDLSKREEDFMSNWLEKIPVVGKVPESFNAAYTGYLNRLRADMFDDIVGKSLEAGVDFNKDPKALRDIARYINSATGRGDLDMLGSDVLTKSAPLLNAVFFSPKLIKSRLDLLNPNNYFGPESVGGYSKVVRKEAIKDLIKFGAVVSSVLTLAALAGAEVETDPRSTSFAKIKSGDTRYDVSGGFAQYITLAARLYQNQKITGTGKLVELDGKGINGTRGSTIKDFGRNKLAPVPAFVVDFLTGSNAIGEEFELTESVKNMMVPLFVQSVADAYEEEGATGAAKALPGMFGIGVSTYPTLTPLVERGTPLSDEMERLKADINIERTLDPEKFPDYPLGELTDEEYADYRTVTAAYFNEIMKEEMASPEWKEMSDEEKKEVISSAGRDSRKWAREEVFGAAAPMEEEEEEAPSEESEDPAEDSEGEEFVFGIPTSMRRTVKGNDAVGGVPNSYHIDGDAIDFVPAEGVSWEELVREAKNFFPGATVIHEKKGQRGEHVHVQQKGLSAPYYGNKGVQ